MELELSKSRSARSIHQLASESSPRFKHALRSVVCMCVERGNILLDNPLNGEQCWSPGSSRTATGSYILATLTTHGTIQSKQIAAEIVRKSAANHFTCCYAWSIVGRRADPLASQPASRFAQSHLSSVSTYFLLSVCHSTLARYRYLLGWLGWRKLFT